MTRAPIYSRSRLHCDPERLHIVASGGGGAFDGRLFLIDLADLLVEPAVPLCHLIGWVINTSDQPIKFDGLIGDAVIRESPIAVGAYDATPIQADPVLASGALIATSADPLTGIPRLVFDGGAGHYLGRRACAPLF